MEFYVAAAENECSGDDDLFEHPVRILSGASRKNVGRLGRRASCLDGVVGNNCRQKLHQHVKRMEHDHDHAR
jgi:hypothetical protein